MTKVCIIGAGISGLATAWKLQQHGVQCTILEKSHRIGGAIQSEHIGGYLLETGPNSIQLNNREIAQFLESIPGLKQQQIFAKAEAQKRFLVRDGRVYSVPMNLLQALATPLWSLSAKLRVLKEPFISRSTESKEESIADFACRRLGNELYRYAINPLVGGIYAGNPEDLSLRYGFPKLYELEQKHGGLIRGALAKMRASKNQGKPRHKKGIISYKDGLDVLPNYLSRALGSSVQTNAQIESIQKIDSEWKVDWNGKSKNFNQVILTIPAFALSKLPLQADLKTALAPLDAIKYPPVSVLSLGFKKEAVKHKLDGFGVLVPECERRSILGVLFPSSYFKGRAPDGSVLLTVFIGGARQPELSSHDATTLIERVLPDLTELLGIHDKPIMQHLTHWPQAIPQYELGYGRYLETISIVEAAHPGLQIIANYRNGISLTNCLETAMKVRI